MQNSIFSGGACPQTPLDRRADNSLGEVECTAHHPGSRGVADIVSVTMSLLSIKNLAVAISTRAGPAEDDPLALQIRVENSPGCLQGREWSS